MSDTLLHIQVFYEIAMAIGNSLDLKKMLRSSLSAYLHKLSCSAGMVLQMGRRNGNVIRFAPVVCIPRNAQHSPACQAALEQIPDCLDPPALNAFCSKLPISGVAVVEESFDIMDLPDFGLLVLLKSGQELSYPILQSLKHLNRKLADSCVACLQNERIEDMNVQLRHEISERLRAEEQLRELLAELELRVESRTQDLRQTNEELKAALANVKTLRGLLPICATCKRVRDDQGYWNQIEAYLSSHSDAHFTHGICPECAKKLYPDYCDDEP
jgi:hypothetical protein